MKMVVRNSYTQLEFGCYLAVGMLMGYTHFTNPICLLVACWILAFVPDAAPKELRIVASIYLGEAISEIVYLTTSNTSPLNSWRSTELIGLGFIAIVLFTTQRRWIAGLLMLFFALITLLLIRAAIYWPDKIFHKQVMGELLINALSTWLLYRWMGKKQGINCG